jgi:hypothetical protein
MVFAVIRSSRPAAARVTSTTAMLGAAGPVIEEVTP